MATPPSETPSESGNRPGRLLIVDDEANAREALSELLADEGYETRMAADGQAALDQMASWTPEVVLTDLKMPRVDGLELLAQGRALAPHCAFVVMTAFASIDTAVTAIQQGAENYLTKPLDLDAVSALVGRALDKARLSAEAASLRQQVERRLSFGGILGDPPSMQRVLKLVAQVAPSRATVLIEGESGTGKELIAAAVHHNSPRRDGPFVRVNCAALAEGVLESELFGHERGAFTGATGRRCGRFEQADGGTLFLDEIGEISAAVQVKLLRFLQEREFERVGGNQTLRVDVRVVAATNQRLSALVEEGRFREDLYYRLNVVQLDMPPLRARRSDVPVLATHFLHKYTSENERDLEGFTDGALRSLMQRPWPGNVRELENTIERAVVLTKGPRVEESDLSPTDFGKDHQDDGLGLLIGSVTMEEVERLVILRTLDAVGGSTAEAARILGISRRKIQYRLRQWTEEAEPTDAIPES